LNCTNLNFYHQSKKKELLRKNGLFLCKHASMKNWFLYGLFLLSFACKDQKVDLSGELPIKQKDFLAIFPTMSLPYSVSDSSIGKLVDTISLGMKALAQFYPDSILKRYQTKNTKTNIHPVGKIEKEKEKYLLVLFSQKKKKQLVVFVTDQKNQFLGAKELLSNDHTDGYRHSLSINNEPTFLISKEKMGANNNLLFTRTAWVYNDAGIFMVVINDSNEDPIKSAVINPLDTLAKKNKLSADYIKDKKNFVSIRDGKDANTYLFFIHFEKTKNDCNAELKGVLQMKTVNKGIYTANGDPCLIDFSFDANKLSIKEQGSCGNHRGIKCFFDDVYTRKKEVKSKSLKRR
jgi:hypothetical protein